MISVVLLVATLSLGSPFSDGCVLQRDRPVPVWGTAESGEAVCVTFADQTKKAVASADGKWRVDLDPLSASSKGRELQVSTATSSLRMVDVLVGEVWLASGQSNMAFAFYDDNPRNRERNAGLVAQLTRCPRLRLAKAAACAAQEPAARVALSWFAAEPKNLLSPQRPISAVGFSFAKALEENLDVPVGLIDVSVGASAIDSWIPAAEYAGMKPPQPGPKRYPPQVYFNGMVAPLAPFACRGFIWYQGESNTKPGEIEKYPDKLRALRGGWARVFENPKLVIRLSQTAPCWNSLVPDMQCTMARYAEGDPLAAACVIADIGNLFDVHPNDKETVGRRLAALALKYDYGFDLRADSPSVHGGSAAADGSVRLPVRDAEKLYLYHPDWMYRDETNRTVELGFELAGADGVWKPARILNLVRTVTGHDPQTAVPVSEFRGQLEGREIVLAADGVTAPVRARHLFRKPWRSSVYNEVSLPLGAFDVAISSAVPVSVSAPASGPVSLTAVSAEIVLSPKAPLVTRFAAKELKLFLGKTLGTDIPVVNAPTPGKASVILGANDWSKAAGLAPEKLPRDGFQIRTAGGKVYIAGVDDPTFDIEKAMAQGRKGNMKYERATVFGVYEFLERFAGVRLYFPGELGTVVQPKQEIRVPETGLVQSPSFTVRHYYQRGDGDWPAETEGEYADGSAEQLNWVRTRMQTRRLAACHGQNGFRITERFRETRPEYLQLRKDGTREDRVPDAATLFSNQGWRYLHLCQSEVWEQLYRDTKDYLSSGKRIPKGIHPEAFGDYYIDVMPQDGFKECFCDKCQKAYDKSVRDYATELVWSQTAAFARRLKADGYGDMLVTQNAYFPYGDVPKCDIPDNVRVMVAKDGPFLARQPGNVDRQVSEVEAWARKLGGGRSVWLWTYPAKWGALDIPLLPQMAPRAYADYYGRMAKCAFGAFAESDSDKAIYNYLNYYVFGKVAWNGTVDVKALLNEHHRLMFGAAAAEMKAFYDGLEKKFLGEVMGREDGITMGPIGPVPNPPSELVLWTQVYDARTMGAWAKLFAAALAKVPSGSLEARRITFIKREFYDGLAKKSEEMRRNYSVVDEIRRRGSSSATNLVKGADFSSLDGWTVSTNGQVAIDRAVCVSEGGSLRLTANDASVDGPYLRAFAKRMLDSGEEKMKPNTKYRISCFVKCENVKGLKRDAGVSLCFHDNVDRALPAKFLTGTTDWVHLSVEFLSKKNTNVATMAFVQPRITNATGTAWFDDIRIEEIP